MKTLRALPVALLIIALLSGCGGLLALISSALAVGDLYGRVTDFLGHDSTDYTLYLDGYNMGIHPSASGTLDLAGLPAGDHVLSLVSDDKRLGFHINTTIGENQRVNLGAVTPLQGGVISGRVQRTVNSSTVPLAGVRVAAILGGAAVVAAGNSPVRLPAGSDKTVILGFTDANGNYSLGPAQFGQWIVTAAYPAYYTDARVVTVASGNDAGGTNLVLAPDSGAAEPATVRGTVTAQGGSALSQALVATTLDTAFAPAVEPARLAALQAQLGGQLGGQLMAQPWFAWNSLATTTTTAGTYDFEVPPGSQAVYAFKFGYRAQTTSVSLSSGQAETLNLVLPAR